VSSPPPSRRLPEGRSTRRRSPARATVSTTPRQDRQPPPPPPTGRWGRDFLGDDYEARTFLQPDDSEGSVVTTLVRYRPGHEPIARRPRFVVVYVHGWSDYFLHTELAEFWHERGAVFYALELRKCGRSLRSHQTPCFVESLTEYDADLDLAVDVVHRTHGASVPVVVVAHSLGGLTTSLWAARHPGALSGLVLNAPFLEIHGSSLARSLSHPLVTQVARTQSRWKVPITGKSFYERTINREMDGEWDIEPAWRPVPTYPVRPGWLDAVMAGHARVAAGLDLPIPILVLTSHRTIISSRWREEMRAADVVLDVKQLWRRLPDLGCTVTLAKIPDAVHDALLSPPAVRGRAYSEIDRWFRGYVAPAVQPAS
jgi:alpha-beta hydrolase superfamily lysophospholipase